MSKKKLSIVFTTKSDKTTLNLTRLSDATFEIRGALTTLLKVAREVFLC